MTSASPTKMTSASPTKMALLIFLVKMGLLFFGVVHIAVYISTEPEAAHGFQMISGKGEGKTSDKKKDSLTFKLQNTSFNANGNSNTKANGINAKPVKVLNTLCDHSGTIFELKPETFEKPGAHTQTKTTPTSNTASKQFSLSQQAPSQQPPSQQLPPQQRPSSALPKNLNGNQALASGSLSSGQSGLLSSGLLSCANINNAQTNGYRSDKEPVCSGNVLKGAEGAADGAVEGQGGMNLDSTYALNWTNLEEGSYGRTYTM
jgi:hypothetical protein